MNAPLADPKSHPSEVRGKYRTRRTITSVLLGTIFLALPWIRIGGHPAILLDVPGRKFHLFGFLFWAHDVPLLLFIAGIFVFGIMLVTSIFGRAWCGWACPETVFIDGVFRRIERAIEGDAVERRRLDGAPRSFEKFSKRTLKWTLYALAAGVISHSFLAYFVGTERLARMVAAPPSEHPVAFAMMIAFAAFTLFNFGWLRERFCTRICPYGRFQTVLLDPDSWVVAYDVRRGEPRRDRKAVPASGAPGDCVACNRCVAACPTGIDIREGLQLECIACTACMDACDSVMAKLGKPPGLIAYGTLRTAPEGTRPEGAGGGRPGRPSMFRSVFRARPILYFTVIVGLVAGLGGVLTRREPLDVLAVRAIGSPYEELKREGAEAEIVNRYHFDVHNLTFADRTVSIVPEGEASDVRFVSNELPLVLRAGERRRISVFMTFPQRILQAGGRTLRFAVKSRDRRDANESIQSEEVRLVGPY